MKTFKHYHFLTLNFLYCLYDKSISGYTVLTARNDQSTGRDADFNLKFCLPFWHLPGGINKRHENLSYCPCWQCHE